MNLRIDWIEQRRSDIKQSIEATHEEIGKLTNLKVGPWWDGGLVVKGCHH